MPKISAKELLVLCCCCCCHHALHCSYVRLELLEGVVAFHSGEAAAAATHLAAAQARWQRLQVCQGWRAQGLVLIFYWNINSCWQLKLYLCDEVVALHLVAHAFFRMRFGISPGCEVLACLAQFYTDDTVGPAVLCCGCCAQLSPGALLQLAEMGYAEQEAQRALRFSGGDLAAAVDFLTEQRQREQVGHALNLGITAIF
jgi:hypothetical protein